METTLNSILKHHPIRSSVTKSNFPVVISQDGNDSKTAEVVRHYCDTVFPLHNIICFRMEYQHDSDIKLRNTKIKKEKRWSSNMMYEHISGHLYFALDKIFSGAVIKQKISNRSVTRKIPNQVIILEEDIMIAPDFFGYFEALAPLLASDDSLLSVSAWNDNGRNGTVKDTTRLLRSDFFPGLGWMMPIRVWDEIKVHWPRRYWDDWLRQPQQRKERKTIRPEVSRSYHFGLSGGASGLLNKRDSLKSIMLNSKLINWSQIDLSYLGASNFHRQYMTNVSMAPLQPSLKNALESVKLEDVRLLYKSSLGFRKLAIELKLLYDEKAGILRSSYNGIVETRPFGENILYLVPFE